MFSSRKWIGPNVDAATPYFTELFIVRTVGFLALLLANVTWIMGYAATPAKATFIGAAYNIEDFCNYLSWMRQTSTGHFFLTNLFTTDHQIPIQFNVLFLFLGIVSRVLHANIAAVFDGAKVVFGGLFLASIWRLIKHCLRDSATARMVAFALTCFSSGWGWLIASRWANENTRFSPIDAWQPEAYTFLSLDTSTLFCASSLLIVCTFLMLLKSEDTRSVRYAVYAGVYALFLTNIHTYDIIHVSITWLIYLLSKSIIVSSKEAARSWGRALVALAIASPALAYQLYMYHADPIFHARAGVPTLSPAFRYYACGYGVVFVLAILGVALLIYVILRRVTVRTAQDGIPHFGTKNAAIFVACWAVGGFVSAYLPVAFQRKMIMGEQIPLCILAGYTVAMLCQRMPRRSRTFIGSLLVLISAPSNVCFLARDFRHLSSNTSESAAHIPYLQDSELAVLEWIAASTGPNDAVLGIPQSCAVVPGWTGHHVWAGHWGETPDFGKKVNEFALFANASTPDSYACEFLRTTETQYLWYPNDTSPLSMVTRGGRLVRYRDLRSQPLACLTLEYANKDYSIYKISS